MAEVNQLNDQHSSDWTLKVAELNSSRASFSLDIINIITDFEVYEHIDKPYITGKLVVADTQRVYERFDFQGGETFTVQIQRDQTESIEPIKKTFIIDEVLHVAKANETSQSIVFHLVEDIGFIDTLHNVNKLYKGQPQKIIKTIAKDFLKKDCSSNAEDNVQNDMNVIVPNLSPLEAMLWIKNRATTKDGYPFFLFSSFALDKFMFYDLGTMLSQKPINPETPYTYSQGIELGGGPQRLFQIFDYKVKNVENVSSLINSGYVGANHNFYDITTAKNAEVNFDVHKDLYNRIGEINKRQSLPLISPNFEYDEKSISDYRSRNITNIFAGKNFDDNKSLTESDKIGDHRRKVVGNAMKQLLTKSPIEIVVNGREFLNGSTNFSIGNNIKVVFKATQDDNPSTKIDRKMSGDYLIHSARHVFSKEKCYSILLITKIANYSSDDYPVG
jgi:hypothetical protein